MGRKIEIELSDPQIEVVTSTKNFNLFLAGVGTGKSHCMGLVSGNFILQHPEARGLIAANTYSQLSGSTLDRIFKVWAEYYGWKQDIHYVVDRQPPKNFNIKGEKLKDYSNTISFYNGALIWTRSLDNYKVIDGMEITYALLDETKDTKEEAVKEVIIARLRQQVLEVTPEGVIQKYTGEHRGYNPLFIFTSPAKTQWLNEMFKINENIDEINKRIFSKTDYYSKKTANMLTVISSTWHNAHNLPKGYIESKVEMWEDTPNLINMNIYGSPIAKTGGEWYKRFERDIHVVDLGFEEGLPLHISMDQNVNPYISGLVIQEKVLNSGVREIRVLKEYALQNPHNNTESLAEWIIEDYGEHLRGHYYYGDPSGKNRSTIGKGVRHNYQMYESKMKKYLHGSSYCVAKSPPPMNVRQTLMNRIMGGNAKVIIVVDPSCKNLINDFDFLKEDGNGGYLKPKVKGENGITYEKYGHHSDALIYYCHYRFGSWLLG